MLNGWGKRGYNNEFTVAAQHQLADRVSVNGGYYRRTFGNQTFTDDLRYDANSYDSFCIKAPGDPDLPDGGGYQVCGVQDLKPSVFAQNLPANSLIRFSEDFGGETNLYQGFDVNIEARFRNGAFLQGRHRRDVADVRQLQPDRRGPRRRRRPSRGNQGTEIYPDGTTAAIASTAIGPTPRCRARTCCPGTSSWPAPTSSPAACRPAARAQHPGQLGDDERRGAAVHRPCVDRRGVEDRRPDSRGLDYGKHNLNQLDLRFAKRFSMGRRRQAARGLRPLQRVQQQLAVHGELAYANTATSAWLRPTNVLQHRFFKFGAQFSSRRIAEIKQWRR